MNKTEREREQLMNGIGSALVKHITPLVICFLFVLMLGIPATGFAEVVPATEMVSSNESTATGSGELTEPANLEEVQKPALYAPFNVIAEDVPNDSGGSIKITWSYPKDKPTPFQFVIERAEKDTMKFVELDKISGINKDYEDATSVDGVIYVYRLGSTSEGAVYYSDNSTEVSSRDHWFNWSRFNVFIGSLVICVFILIFIQMARSGRELYVRRIAGLSAVEDAIGRATEMGKPILYCPGTGYIEDVSTVASLNLLGEITRRIVHYNVRLICPNFDPIVYTVAREIVKESYSAEGRPDYYDPDSVFFVVNNQFAYAAAVDGMMLREKPATNFFIGYFSAESLILAETGSMTGAIQIAGTDHISQLPFFITACDYTLIGEELYASSAYLSRNALLMGTLKGQDYSKLVIILCIVLLTILNLIFPDWNVVSFFKTGGA